MKSQENLNLVKELYGVYPPVFNGNYRREFLEILSKEHYSGEYLAYIYYLDDETSIIVTLQPNENGCGPASLLRLIFYDLMVNHGKNIKDRRVYKYLRQEDAKIYYYLKDKLKVGYGTDILDLCRYLWDLFYLKKLKIVEYDKEYLMGDLIIVGRYKDRYEDRLYREELRKYGEMKTRKRINLSYFYRLPGMHLIETGEGPHWVSTLPSDNNIIDFQWDNIIPSYKNVIPDYENSIVVCDPQIGLVCFEEKNFIPEYSVFINFECWYDS
ncbi:MAG: hypothetical protein RMJ18_01450 [Candidatus Aenigmarchaeota archaeon]|nr:hypothetical protein [Candidatus Aenigmarchaeota archaeon]MDW8160067.1 hypothetical protein [Candidatus Aenigmarchaeota archaeon]